MLASIHNAVNFQLQAFDDDNCNCFLTLQNQLLSILVFSSMCSREIQCLNLTSDDVSMSKILTHDV